MPPAQEGILTQCRGFVALLAALLSVFAIALQPDGDANGAQSLAADQVISASDFEKLLARIDLCETAPEAGVLSSTGQPAVGENVIEAFHVGSHATDGLFVPVTIDCQKWWFLVDTGCNETVVDCEVAIHVGLIERKNKPCRWGHVYRTLHATVGNSRLPLKCRAVCFDLSHLRECYERFPLCGILGMDFLRQYVIRIDLDAGNLSFLKTVSENPGSELILSRDAYDLPHLRIAMAKDVDDWFLVDTGCSGPVAGTIERGLFIDLAAGRHLSDVRGPITRIGFHGKELCDEAALDVFQIGKFEHHGLQFLSDTSDNLLGLGYLSRYVVTLDFPNNRMYLKTGDHNNDPPAAPAVFVDTRK